jgi:hypothetical protein
VIESNIIGGLLLVAFAAMTLRLTNGHVGFFIMMIVVAMLIFPVAAMFDSPKGWPRTAMLCATIGLALLGIIVIVIPFALPDNEETFRWFKRAISIYAGGILASQLAGNAFPMLRPKQ